MPPCAPGDLLELAPHDLSPDGGSVAELNGFVVFLDRGLPGEKVRARVRSVKSRFARAEVTEISVPLAQPAPAYCPHLGTCGGCAWPGLDHSLELAWKERQVRELFRRVGRLREADVLFHPAVPSPLTLGYRNKLEFAFARDCPPGLRRRDSHSIVPVDDCALARSPVGDILAFARRLPEACGRAAPKNAKGSEDAAGFLRRLVVRLPDYAPEGEARCLVELITAPPKACGLPRDLVRDFGAALMRDVPKVTGFVHSLRAGRDDVAQGEKILHTLGRATMCEQIGHILLEAPVNAFLQVNTGAAALMYAEVRRLAGPFLRPDATRLWDLYCGAGGIGLFLAGAQTRVHGFEGSRAAVVWAGRNAERNGLRGCSFTAGDIARETEAAAAREGAPDIVVTDPPRAGLSRELCETLLRLRPRAIIAVSCDPASQARDIARLARAYRVREVRPFDFFPHTPHVETVVLLEREERTA